MYNYALFQIFTQNGCLLLRANTRLNYEFACRRRLTLPLVGEITQPLDHEARQCLTNRDKESHPPIRYHATTTFPERVQATTSAETRCRERVNLQTDTLPLLAQTVEVGRNTGRAYGRNFDILVAHLFGEGHRETLQVRLACAVQSQPRPRHPYRVGGHIEDVTSASLCHIGSK